MIVKRQNATAEDLLATSSNGYRYELVEGVIRQMAPAGDQHGRTIMPLAALLYVYVESRELGFVYGAETGFVLGRDPDTVLAPDVAFVSTERAAQVQVARGFGQGAPDLVVEVASPSDSAAELEEKIQMWIASGVSMAIVVWPQSRTITIHRAGHAARLLTEQDTLSGENVVPGWTLSVQRIFRQT